MKRFIRTPSPSMVVACAALFVSLGGVSYAVATIDSADIVNGSIRNRDFKDGTLRGQESKPDGFGPNAIKEQALDASKIGQVPSAALAEGVVRQAVVSDVGAMVRGRGVASSALAVVGSRARYRRRPKPTPRLGIRSSALRTFSSVRAGPPSPATGRRAG